MACSLEQEGFLSRRKHMEGEREGGGEEHWEVPKSKGSPAGVSSCQESVCVLRDNKPSEVQCLVGADVKEPMRCSEGKIHSDSPLGD